MTNASRPARIAALAVAATMLAQGAAAQSASESPVSRAKIERLATQEVDFSRLTNIQILTLLNIANMQDSTVEKSGKIDALLRRYQ
ncbi:hypothetical protein [Roseivivax isoporae]|uniref:Uncharacterized protein n=1 Tax=Roseivivax isoporae LMG 25204 TaxID=1449351 RepID=X7F868_9RHOB|nr:hypothetical protein [Roseivivax isoporae]ETX28274.1 hypothetical protein RISW2_08755 [Roseivivax isoporae LMG 25204]